MSFLTQVGKDNIILEHSKRQVLEMRILGDNVPLKFLLRKYDLKSSGGAMSVNQKGRSFTSSFKGQPTITLNMEFYVGEPEFHISLMEANRKGHPIIVAISSLFPSWTVWYKNAFREWKDENASKDLTQESETEFVRGVKHMEAIGYISNMSISAQAGNYILVNVSLLVDDYKVIDRDNLDNYIQ